MQLQFEKEALQCLHTVKREIQSHEQTQEVRITDGMPDIGRIIGAWGQVILRSKEWQRDGMTVSGGTMVWVQYMPEDGGEVQCIESWLPFQMRWAFPETQHDGKIMTQCILKSVDARSTSARKLILRTNVAVLGWAMESRECDLYSPRDVPEDVQLRRIAYPMQLPVEAGEKAFSLEETLNLPPSVPKPEKVMAYHLQPEITEEKMMGDKVVFRGTAVLHLLYLAEDGGQYTWDFDLPFTQYNELDGEYGDDAQVMLWPCVTAMELESDGDTLNLKAGMVCQYRVSRRTMVEMTEDAYSPRRSVVCKFQNMDIPGVLESKTQNVRIQQNSPVDGMRLTDVQFLPQPVSTTNGEACTALDLSGTFQLLYYDMEGNPRTSMQRWEDTLDIPKGDCCAMEATFWLSGKPQGSLMSGSAQLSAEGKLMAETMTTNSMPVVTGLELGELQEADSRRPSLILRRANGQNLWDLAKTCGSSVKSIQDANGLENDPEATQMLLIPIL